MVLNANKQIVFHQQAKVLCYKTSFAAPKHLEGKKGQISEDFKFGQLIAAIQVFHKEGMQMQKLLNFCKMRGIRAF
jgi:hypothetical protein